MADNLQALRRHRPELFERLAGSAGGDRYRLIASKSGHLTILARRDDGSTVCLSPNHDPLATVRAAMAQLQQPIARGEMLTLAGLGDAAADPGDRARS
jgi:hypothetical protein